MAKETLRQNKQTTTQAAQEAYFAYLLKSQSLQQNWETIGNPDLTLDDIDTDEVRKTVRLALDCDRINDLEAIQELPDILSMFHVMRKGVLNNAAAVLFARDEAAYPQCMLRLARFRGTDKSEIIDSKCVRGNIFRQLDAAMTFIFRQLPMSGTFYEQKHQAIPYLAVREALINCLVHRSYKDPDGSAGIAIYDDRIEIENTGSFPYVPDMKTAETEPVTLLNNPLIAGVLYRRNLLQNWGRGLCLIHSTCRQAAVPAPEYVIDENCVRVIFRCPQVKAEQPSAISLNILRTIQALSGTRLSRAELMQAMGLKDRKSFLQNYFNPAFEAKVIAASYPDVAELADNQRYKVSAAGKQFI